MTRARRKETMRGAVKLFRVLMDAVDRHAQWAEARTGLDAARLWALWELRQAPGLRPVDLAKTMAVHRLKAEELLRGLAMSGLARRLPDTDDAAATYTLTEAGKRLAQSIPEHGQGALMSAFEHLPDAALQQLVEALRPLVEVLPFREDRAALQPVAVRPQVVRPQVVHAHTQTRRSRRADAN